MTAEQTRKAALAASLEAQARVKRENEAIDAAWVCNECNSRELSAAVNESDLDWFACSNCGGNDFHLESTESP